MANNYNKTWQIPCWSHQYFSGGGCLLLFCQ